MTALISVVVVVVLIVAVLFAALKVLREYERGVVFRLGRLIREPRGPGLIFLIPVIDRMVRIDLRTVTLTVPPQEVITRDNVPVRVNAVAYFRVVDPTAAVVEVEKFLVATSQIAQTTLRSTLGQHMLDELLSERDKINAILQRIIDDQTAPWGVKVSNVEVKDVEIPTLDAARHGPAGRGRARAARQGDRGRGRVPGVAEARRRRPGALGAPRLGAAALPPDDARDVVGAHVDGHLPDPDRPDRAPQGRTGSDR